MKISQRKTQIAKTLRKQMTDSELALWRQLRAHRNIHPFSTAFRPPCYRAGE
jgi:very-short-patch-repair endonuclease